jgi:hypothetical protein
VTFLGLSCVSSLLELGLDNVPVLRQLVPLRITSIPFSLSITFTLLIIGGQTAEYNVEIIRASSAYLIKLITKRINKPLVLFFFESLIRINLHLTCLLDPVLLHGEGGDWIPIRIQTRNRSGSTLRLV